jgi:Fe-S-cluster containining protein
MTMTTLTTDAPLDFDVFAVAPDATPTGSVTTWLRKFEQRLRDGTEAQVPCGTCNACCTCGYEVEVFADDDPSLEAVPSSKDGARVLVRNADGSCRYLIDGKCSVYDRRPRACREFDCRVFVLTGLVPRLLGESGAMRRWDPIDATKTTDDKVASVALRMATFEAYRGFGTVEVACAAGVASYRNYLPMARELYAHLRSHPEELGHIADAMQDQWKLQQGDAA